MLVVNRSPYSYYLKNQDYPVPAGASLEIDNELWASDDELARVIESLDRWNIVSVTDTLPDNYPRTSAFPEVVNLIGGSSIISTTEPDGDDIEDGSIMLWYDPTEGEPTLRAKSKDEAGTVFTVTIPLTEEV
jgi:hypothetical protein